MKDVKSIYMSRERVGQRKVSESLHERNQPITCGLLVGCFTTQLQRTRAHILGLYSRFITSDYIKDAIMLVLDSSDIQLRLCYYSIITLTYTFERDLEIICT